MAAADPGVRVLDVVEGEQLRLELLLLVILAESQAVPELFGRLELGDPFLPLIGEFDDICLLMSSLMAAEGSKVSPVRRSSSSASSADSFTLISGLLLMAVRADAAEVGELAVEAELVVAAAAVAGAD